MECIFVCITPECEHVAGRYTTTELNGTMCKLIYLYIDQFSTFHMEVCHGSYCYASALHQPWKYLWKCCFWIIGASVCY